MLTSRFLDPLLLKAIFTHKILNLLNTQHDHNPWRQCSCLCKSQRFNFRLSLGFNFKTSSKDLIETFNWRILKFNDIISTLRKRNALWFRFYVTTIFKAAMHVGRPIVSMIICGVWFKLNERFDNWHWANIVKIHITYITTFGLSASVPLHSLNTATFSSLGNVWFKLISNPKDGQRSISVSKDPNSLTFSSKLKQK